MKKTITLATLIIMFSSSLVRAEWVPLNGKATSPSLPNISLVSDDNTSTVLKIEISGFELKDLNSGKHNYQVIDLLSESFTKNPGCPRLPYIAKILAVPDQASISVEILETGKMQSFTNISLPPARESWVEGSPETPYIENPLVYNSIKGFPGEFAQLDKPSVFRDFRIVRVSMFPVHYLPAKKELQVVSSITIRINYGTGKIVNPKTSAQKPIAPSFGKLYRSTIFNYQSVLDKSYGGKENGHELMLCIMPDEFFASFEDYAEWKRHSGIDIHITKFSDIGANTTDPNIIKDHISDAYFNWETAPTYVLLVGDAGIMPTFSGGTIDENRFVEIEGNDFLPDLLLGRFTNESDYGMQVITNKLIKYEKEPYITSTEWFKKGICCSNDEYASQIATKRFAAERMLQDGGFTSVDTMMSDPGCTYSISDVVNSINEGRSYLNYRGEGWSSGWWATCTPMHTPDVSNLANGQKLTFVTSIGCGVAMFGSSGGNSFGEEWLELGTISNPKGACAFIGPTGNTHTTYNNKIDKGIYIGMFQEGMDTPGQALVRGKLYMYNVFGNDPYVESHFKLFCLLGDPSTHIWKDIPQAITVNYPETIPFGINTVEFTVTNSSTGQAVSNALVCVTGDTLFSTSYTDEFGKAYIDIEALELETLNVTVRGGNVVPFLGTLLVAPASGPYVIKDSYLINDIEGGNGNGLMDYGETNLLSLTMKNIGVEMAEDVTVTINSGNPYITITDSTADYGNIAPGSTAVVADGFTYLVTNNIPDAEEVSIAVTATNGSDSWQSFVVIMAHAPAISIGMLSISDPDGNNNGLLDPGETAILSISVSNDGSSLSPGALANIGTTSAYVTLDNISYDLGQIDTGSTVDALFGITVSPTAPIGETVDIAFDVIAGEYNASKPFVTSIGLIIEDWETGGFDKFPWTMSGNSDWTMDANDPYEGVYSAKSGNISDSQTSNLEVVFNIVSDGEITFYKKVSSENNWDFLKFFIDGNQMDQWSGNVPWGMESFTVTTGVHTFKWQYYKDSSVSNGEDCAWIDYIIFPSTVFAASFGSNETNICEDGFVDFYDQSPGSPISWDWVFEGGTPGTSTLQNPVIEYSASGTYDVSLTVSDGTTTDTKILENYITVSALPETAPIPTGPTSVCGNEEISLYSTTGLTGITEYNWLLEPAEAGSVGGSSLNGNIFWTSGYLGEATLQVAGENLCGTGNYSETLNITRYLPEVTLEPFDWVCLNWPEIELSGGMPSGGEYSGPGVENGWFYPEEAGIGTHTITYTYSDAGECENFATETILVDACTGINSPADHSGITVYPNPTTGTFTVEVDQATGSFKVIVINTLNDVVYSSESPSGNKLDIDLSNMAKSVYFVKVKTGIIEKTIKVVLR